MTENGDPRENAIAERVNGILKEEWLNKEMITTPLPGSGYSEESDRYL